MRNTGFALVLGVAIVAGVACGDDGGQQPPVDAAAGDGSGGSACTNALYDPCTDASQCASGMCRQFNMPSPGIQICTQACSQSTPCPMQNGLAVTCTNASVCRPAAANSCTR